MLFGIGLWSDLLAVRFASRYCLCRQRGFRRPEGVNLDFRRGKFLQSFTALTSSAPAWRLFQTCRDGQLLVGVQVMNGVHANHSRFILLLIMISVSPAI